MLVHPDSTLGALNDYALYKSTHSLSHSAFDTRLHTRPPQTNDVNRLAEIYSVNRFSHIGVKNCSSGGSCFLLIFLKTNVIFCKKSLISYGGSNEGPHRAAPYEEFFSPGAVATIHCPLEVGAYGRRRRKGWHAVSPTQKGISPTRKSSERILKSWRLANSDWRGKRNVE